MSASEEDWDRFMVELDQSWNEKFDHASKKEGWALFNHDGILQIQAIDNPEDDEGSLDHGDGEAYNLCVEKALAGSKMHALALLLDGRDAFCVYVPKALLE